MAEYQEHDGEVDGNTSFVGYCYRDGWQRQPLPADGMIYPAGPGVRLQHRSLEIMRTFLIIVVLLSSVSFAGALHQQRTAQQLEDQGAIVLGSDGHSSWGIVTEKADDGSLKSVSLVEDKIGGGVEMRFHGTLDGRVLRTLVTYRPVGGEMHLSLDFGADGAPDLRFRGPGLEGLAVLQRATVNSAQATLEADGQWVDVEVLTRNASDGVFAVLKDGTTYIFSWKHMKWRDTDDLLDELEQPS